jgi:uroporphyrinogen decarboxylase
MRQAGRYMAEYRELRQRYSLLEICRTPDLATAVTLQPVRRIDVDAAILFSDLRSASRPWAFHSTSSRAKGRRSRTRSDRKAIWPAVRRFEPREALAHVLVAIQQIQRELRGRVPLIGFAGAPFTLASYAIEGGH